MLEFVSACIWERIHKKTSRITEDPARQLVPGGRFTVWFRAKQEPSGLFPSLYIIKKSDKEHSEGEENRERLEYIH